MKESEHFPDPHHDVSANTVFGFWVYLMTDCILFATLFAAYAVLKDGTFGGPSAKEILILRDALWMTLVLAASAFTCGIASLQIAQNNVKKLAFWYGATFLLGFIFIGMVGDDFDRLIELGNGWQANAFLTSYFTLMGTHALHIAFGLLFMIVFVAQAIRWGFTPMVVRRLHCLKIFWFFSYLIWIFMFTIVYLIGAT